MNRSGLALIATLGIATSVFLLGIGMAFMAQMNATTARNLNQQLQARYVAEAGIEHALVYLRQRRPSQTVTLSHTLGAHRYAVTITPEGEGYRAESLGTLAGGARHVAAATIAVPSATDQPRSAPIFGQGIISGGRISISGGIELRGQARLHGDLGYASLSGGIELCEEGGHNCERIDRRSHLPPPISGGVALPNVQCNASGNTAAIVCNGSRPRIEVCPVYRSAPSPPQLCTDALSGQQVLWDEAARISAPDVNELAQARTGARVTAALADAQANRLCDLTVSSFPGQASELTALLSQFPIVQALTHDVNRLSRLLLEQLSGSGRRICVQNNATLPADIELNNLTFYVGGTFQVNGRARLNDVTVVAQGGMNLDRVQAANSRFYANQHINMNNDADFQGDSAIASRSSITFNGSSRMLGRRTLLIASEGDITFNGRSDLYAYLWARGNVHFNGTGGLIGGVVALGDTFRNGGGQFFLQHTSAENSDLPQSDAQEGRLAQIQFRR